MSSQNDQAEQPLQTQVVNLKYEVSQYKDRIKLLHENVRELKEEHSEEVRELEMQLSQAMSDK